MRFMPGRASRRSHGHEIGTYPGRLDPRRCTSVFCRGNITDFFRAIPTGSNLLLLVVMAAYGRFPLSERRFQLRNGRLERSDPSFPLQ